MHSGILKPEAAVNPSFKSKASIPAGAASVKFTSQVATISGIVLYG